MDADRHEPDRSGPEQKTSIRDGRTELFDFLGYTFRATVLVENRKTLHRRECLKEELK